MWSVYLIHTAILFTVTFWSNHVHAVDTITQNNYSVSTAWFNVIHTPNFYPNAQHTRNSNNNKMAVRVEGNDKIFLLDNTHSTDRLVYSGAVDTPLPFSWYKYVVLDENNNEVESEPFNRHLNDQHMHYHHHHHHHHHQHHNDASAAVYDFFGRHHHQQLQQQALPQVNWSYKHARNEYQYREGLDRSQVHPTDDIPTWHIQTSASDFEALRENILQDIGITANISRITINHIQQFQNVKVELSGQTSRLFKKLSYSVHMDKQESINGYRRFKLRSCATDPSYIREKLYYDIIHASKLPSAKASFIRLFINQEPQGLYLIVDNYKNPFIKNVLGNGSHNYKQGILYQGKMQENPIAVGKLKLGANLAYLGPSPNDYIEPSLNTSVYKVLEAADGSNGEKNNDNGNNSRDSLTSLVSLLRFINKSSSLKAASTNRNNKKLTYEWNRRFDVSLFLKHLVLEVLLGHGDGYMGAAHNYMLYQDPDQGGRFVWLASDLDQTMGNTLQAKRSAPDGSAFQQLDRYGLFDQTNRRPLVDCLFQIKAFVGEFYQLFSDINRSLFQSDAIAKHIGYLQELIEQDVAWDQRLDAYRPDNFRDKKQAYDSQLNEKVLQLPLGHDFINRIDNKTVSFKAAIEGPIAGHPSIASLFTWFTETSQYLDEFVHSLETNINN